MSFSVSNEKVVYILVSIKIYQGKYRYSGHYYCDLLGYSTGTWCRYDYDSISEFSGYPDSVYGDLSHADIHKKGKTNTMKGSEKIVSMLYIKEKLSYPELTHF